VSGGRADPAAHARNRPDLVRPLERAFARATSRSCSAPAWRASSRVRRLRVEFSRARRRQPRRLSSTCWWPSARPKRQDARAELAGVKVSERGFIPVDRQMRTNVPHIFAIGDVAAPPLLAHKACHEGKVAAEVAAGHKRAADWRVIPSVAYTDPEIAWVGLTETDARANGTAFRKGAFPWVANGRSLSLGREEGFTKLLFDPDNHRVLGGGIVGSNAGELISEIALAVETGCDGADIGSRFIRIPRSPRRCGGGRGVRGHAD